MSVDPVCGMSVDEKKAPFASRHEGRQFYFCSKGCKEAFDRSPTKYAKA
jgi:YHS domain-containing protein